MALARAFVHTARETEPAGMTSSEPSAGTNITAPRRVICADAAPALIVDLPTDAGAWPNRFACRAARESREDCLCPTCLRAAAG